MSQIILKYQNETTATKLQALLNYYGNSSKLAHNLGVSRTSVVRWQDDPGQIRDRHLLDIDVLYCDTYLTPELDKIKTPPAPTLLPDNYTWNVAAPFLQKLSFGTYEIEEPGTDRALFDKAISDTGIPPGLDRRGMFGMLNVWFTHRELWQLIVAEGKRVDIDPDYILDLHVRLMRGVMDTPGKYSTLIRKMGRLEDISTTDPEDIPAEIGYWCAKYAGAETIQDIAKAHAHFIMIHPFGDGNGRVGRALMFIHSLVAGIMPPVLNRDNQALYYSSMAFSMRHGRYGPLVQLLVHAGEN